MMTDKVLVKNAADPSQVSRGESAEKRRERDRLNNWKAVLSSKNGRAVMWDVLSMCNMFQVYRGDSDMLQFHEGQRSVGVQIWQSIEGIDNDIIHRMMTEAKEETYA